MAKQENNTALSLARSIQELAQEADNVTAKLDEIQAAAVSGMAFEVSIGDERVGFR